MTSLLDCSPPPRRVGMQGSRRRKGKGGIAVVAKECVEWDVSTDNYHATAPASMMPSLKQWHNPLYRHEASTSSSFEDDAATTREIDIDSGRTSVRDLGSTCDDAGTRSGRGWTIAVCALMGCRDVYGVSVSLDLMAEVVLSLSSCELQKAAKEFDAVIQEKRAALTCIFVPSGGHIIPFSSMVLPVPSVNEGARFSHKFFAACVGSLRGTLAYVNQGPQRAREVNPPKFLPRKALLNDREETYACNVLVIQRQSV